MNGFRLCALQDLSHILSVKSLQVFIKFCQLIKNSSCYLIVHKYKNIKSYNNIVFFKFCVILFYFYVLKIINVIFINFLNKFAVKMLYIKFKSAIFEIRI